MGITETTKSRKRRSAEATGIGSGETEKSPKQIPPADLDLQKPAEASVEISTPARKAMKRRSNETSEPLPSPNWPDEEVEKKEKGIKKKKIKGKRKPVQELGDGMTAQMGTEVEKGKAGERASTLDTPQSGTKSGNSGTGGESTEEWEDIPLSERLLHPDRKTVKRPRTKGGRRRYRGRGTVAPRVRLRGIFRRISTGPKEVKPAEWHPDPPLSTSPDESITQASVATEVLKTLRARAHMLDSLGSPLPVSGLLGGLCSASPESAAAVVTLTTERFARGLAREGPVWGLPKEVVYAITGHPPPAGGPESAKGKVPRATRGEGTSGGPRKGIPWRPKQRPKPDLKHGTEAKPEEKASGESRGKKPLKGVPRAKPKDPQGPRPPRKDNKGKP